MPRHPRYRHRRLLRAPGVRWNFDGGGVPMRYGRRIAARQPVGMQVPVRPRARRRPCRRRPQERVQDRGRSCRRAAGARDGVRSSRRPRRAPRRHRGAPSAATARTVARARARARRRRRRACRSAVTPPNRRLIERRHGRLICGGFAASGPASSIRRSSLSNCGDDDARLCTSSGSLVRSYSSLSPDCP